MACVSRSTRFVCFDPADLAQNMASFMNSSIPSCAFDAALVPRDNEHDPSEDSEFSDEDAAITDQFLFDNGIYPDDVTLWQQHCSSALALASHQRGHLPTPSEVWLNLRLKRKR